MYCPKCGYENTDSALFCKKCGKSLKIKTTPLKNKDSKSNYKILIVIITLIIIAIIITGTFILLNNNSSVSNDSSYSTAKNETIDAINQNSDILHIINGTIYTSSSGTEQSKCVVFVGKEHSNEKVKISTLYSRDGSNLNPGKKVATTVDNSGYITVKSAYPLKYYPDYVYIAVYDNNDNVLDTKGIYLSPTSGTQTF